RLRRARPDSENSPAATEPIHIDSFGLTVETPHKARIIRVILWMHRRCRANSDEITRVRVRLRAAIHKIDIHLGEKVVFLLFARREEKLFANGNVVCGALAFYSAIWFATQIKFLESRRVWLIDNRADRRQVFGIQNHALVALGEMIQQDGIANASATIR